MKIKPTGFHILVKVGEISETFENSRIVRPTSEKKREQGGYDVGTVLAFGPICFKGFAHCEGPGDWGVKIGDLVEFSRYDGKIPRYAEVDKDMENLRLITDSDILAVLEK